MMHYKGYTGHVAYDSKAKIFHGRVIGLKDVITFQGESVNEIEQAFVDSVDTYLDFCKERGEKPEKAFSGKLVLRINPELHEHLAYTAAEEGISLNDLLIQKLNIGEKS